MNDHVGNFIRRGVDFYGAVESLHSVPRSPDLNPVEKFWSWLRRRLQALDDDDLRRGRPPLGKKEYKQRVRRVCRSRRAQQVAAACASGLHKVCREVIAKKGAATKG